MFEKNSSSESAVSPVIGIILMVAITVALVALVTLVVFDIGGNTSQTPKGTVESEINIDTGSITLELIRNANIEDIKVRGAEDPSIISDEGDVGSETIDIRTGATDVEISAIVDGEEQILRTIDVPKTIGSKPDKVIFGSGTNLYAVDSRTGTVEWNFSQPSEQFQDYIRLSPTVADGTVYVGNGRSMYALDVETGNKKWKRSDIEVEEAATVVDDTVYVGSSNAMYALDVETGKTQWKFNDSGNIVVSSAPLVEDGTVFFGVSGTTVYALDAETGNKEWEYDEFGGTVASSPINYDGLILAGSNYNGYHAIDKETGKQVWTFKPGIGIVSSATVVDGTAYFGGTGYDDLVYALDATTGNKKWEVDPEPGFFDIKSSPTVVNGIVYIGDNSGDLYAIDAETRSKQWEFDTGGKLRRSSPTIANGTLYITGGGAAYGIDVETGNQVWKSGPNSPRITATPTVVGTNGNSIGSRVKQETLGHID